MKKEIDEEIDFVELKAAEDTKWDDNTPRDVIPVGVSDEYILLRIIKNGGKNILTVQAKKEELLESSWSDAEEFEESLE